MARGKLRFSNRYVFAKVMQDNPDLCREVIERVLGVEVGRVEAMEVESEATEVIRRSVQFDVFLKGPEAAFEVEMQTYEQRELPLRMRYYRSQLDRRLLSKGARFSELRPTYIIFICTDDPFGFGLPVYTFRSRCLEDGRVPFENGATDVVLNAGGDLALADPAVASLLEFVSTDVARGDDPLTSRLSRAVGEALEDEEWVKSVSNLDWDIQDAREVAEAKGLADGMAKGLEKGLAEGRAEGRAEGLVEGEAVGQSRMAKLMKAMLEADCAQENLVKATEASGKELEGLYAQYGIA